MQLLDGLGGEQIQLHFTQGFLHFAVSTHFMKRSRNGTDQFRNLLMLMIWFDRFHINGPVRGGKCH